MQISVLGPVEVTADGRSVAIGKGKPRALLAVLALDEGSTVSSERLVEALWGEDPPPTAAKMVQLYVSQVRKALAASGDGAEIVTRGRGYELRLGDGDVDALRFAALVADDLPREALALWRGVAARRRRRGAVRGRRDPPPRGAAPDRGRARDRRRPGGGPPSRGPRRARGARRPRPAARRAAGAADARALPLGPPGTGAAGLPAGAIGARRADRRRARTRAARAARRDPAPGSAARPAGARIRAAAGRALRGHAARGPSGRARRAARGVARRARRRRALRPRARRPRNGEDAAGRGAGGRGAPRPRHRAARLRRRRSGSRARRDLPRAHARGARRCSSSTTSTAPARRWAGACASWSRASTRCRSSSSPRRRPTTRRGAARRCDASRSEPLGPDDVAAVARLYADPREDVEVPIAAWCRTAAACRARSTRPRSSGRGPSASAAWAVPPGARRRAAPGCARPRTSSRATSSSRWRPRASEPSRSRTGVVVCPFKGLAAFEPEDAAFFFGRERLVAEMVARLAGAPMLGLVGPSGSGKSSVLRAGLLAGPAPGRPARQRDLGDRAAAPGRASAARAARRDLRGGARRAARARRRPARGGLRGLPRRGRARGVHGRAGRVPRATRAGGRSCSWPSARTSTAAAPPIRSCGGCWAPTRRPSGRCAATSCAARSSCRPVTPAWRSSPT